MNRPRVLLADDHTVVSEGIRRLLDPHFEVVGVASDGRALVEAAEQLKPDAIVADITMPLLNGIEAARQLKKANPQARIVFLTMHPDATYATEALEAGGSGYVLKTCAGFELVTAIREAIKGRRYVTPVIGMPVMRSLLDPVRKQNQGKVRLTARQREVLQMVAEGHSAQEIADILQVSVRMVEFHRRRLEERLGLHTTAELTQYAIRSRVI